MTDTREYLPCGVCTTTAPVTRCLGCHGTGELCVPCHAELWESHGEWLEAVRRFPHPQHAPVPESSRKPHGKRTWERPNIDVMDGGEHGRYIECAPCDGDGWIGSETELCTWCGGYGLQFQPKARPPADAARVSAMDAFLEYTRSHPQPLVALPPDPQQEFFSALLANKVTFATDIVNEQYIQTRIHVDPPFGPS
ncbi:CR-type zinc finger domain protein [Rhodococcus phage Mbo2]|uniref:CR-type zinc finger domain protein n=1 Tax=Rhodococcus phage Mbo2 TaxID=2936911 RepID=A0A9E7IEJ3_9CAUD|nr:CR-type zinc finger domain protein [Rhodococcus phage Mbo2]